MDGATQVTLAGPGPVEAKALERWRWPWAALAVAAVVLAGLYAVSQTIRVPFGLFSHPPIYGIWHPVLTSKIVWVIPTGLLLAVLALVLATSGRIAAHFAVPSLIGAGVVVAAAIALVRGNVSGLTRGVSTAPSAPYYTSDLHFVTQYGIRGFFTHYIDLAQQFHSPASRSHPPGALVLLNGVFQLVGADHALRISTFLAVLSMCAAIPAWVMGRELGGPRAGLIAAILFVAAPGPLLLAYTSMDAIYATVLSAAVAAFMLAIHRLSPAWAAVGGVVLGLATVITYASVFIAIATVIAVVVQTRDLRESARLLGAAAAGGVGVLAVAWGALGYNVVESFRGNGINFGTDGPIYSAYWFLGAPLALLLFAGLPIATFAVIGLVRPLPGTRRAVLPLALIVFFLVWVNLPAQITSLRQGEVERTWALLYPVLAAVAAPIVARWTAGASRKWVGGAIVAGLVMLSVAQATLYQALWDTVF